MALHLQREIHNLKKRILVLSGFVEESVESSVCALTERDSHLAEKVIIKDRQIDNMEVDVEEECLKILALYQPVAIDLRFITAVMRINNDLERIGDIAVNMAKRALLFNDQVKPAYIPKNFSAAAAKARGLLAKSLDALVNMDDETAKRVLAEDDEIDDMCAVMFEEIKDEISNHPDQIDTLSHVLVLPRSIERIADHATNIAEDLIYMIKGEIVRHGGA